MADVGDTRIRVILRLRPPNDQEKRWFKSGEFKPLMRDPNQTPSPETTLIQDATGKEHKFDRVFRFDCRQVTIFREAALSTLENVFKGYCGAIMAYGQTGTGKTHTMQGYDKSSDGDERGVIPRCADYIFARSQKETMYSFEITIGMVQIYLDKLQDLFQPDAPEMNITPDTERVEMPGLTEKKVNSTAEFMKLYYFGEAHRVTRATLMNPTSSRGHAATIVNIKMEPKDPSMSTKVGKLVLVDLAGYERFAQTGITTGIAAEEAKKINASLLALGAVVNSLADRQKHVPYRNAKLTRLLRDCLGGTSKSTIVLTIGPCDRYKQETAGTLYFGFRAMAVKVDARIRETYDPAKYIALLKEKIGECAKTMTRMVKHMKDKGVYNSYVDQYGTPEIPDTETGDDEEMEILGSLGGLGGSSGDMSGGGGGGGGAAMMMLDDDDDDQAPEGLREVRKEWNNELNEHQIAAQKEMETLRLRHLQDIEDARRSGASEDVLAQLRREHEEEMRGVKEQNQILRGDLLRQKQKEETKALLAGALDAKVDKRGAMGSKAVQQDNARISEMVSHLQETCENKDEVLVRLFDLICLREAELKDLEGNVTAIAAAMAPADGAGGAAPQLQAENRRLKADLQRKEQHIEALKGLLGSQAPPSPPTSGGGASPTRTVSPAARPGGAPVVRQPGQAVVRQPMAGAGAPPRFGASPTGAPRPVGATSPQRMPGAPGAPGYGAGGATGAYTRPAQGYGSPGTYNR